VASQRLARRTGYLLVADTRIAAAALPRGRWRYRQRSTPSLETRKARFTAVLRHLPIAPKSESDGLSFADRLAAAYPLDLQGLTTASALAVARFREETTPEGRERAFSAACRMVATPDLLQLAHRLEPIYEIKSVILPEDRVAQLEEIVANVLHSRAVLEGWGFGAQLPYGRGVAGLFAGPSGTGKTMAAQAIARRLGVDVFAVDLSRIVSKYIGETEKHLDAVFVDAERSGSVLLFDEADALFGKRSEVKDAHDRYANLEVAYLLQRMEAFGGLAILTTNHRQNLDSSFVRRLRFIVEFPKPDAEARKKIWQLCFPSPGIVDADVDWRLLARFDLSGGIIRQVTLRAAFMAARDKSTTIKMQHLLAALRCELTKLGMQTAERELLEIDQLRAQQREQKQDAA
jgi:SpoVK/Ycf46/Vps4 family AAA+-type ATPase